MNHLRLFRLPRLLTPWDRYLPVMWTIGVGVAFSLAVFFAVRWWEYQDIAKIFQLAAEDRALAVKGTFGTEAAMLELVRSSLDGDAHPRRNEFRRLVTPFLSHSRSIEAVEWVPRVAESERAKFVADARRDGIEGFRITEMGRDGRMEPAPRRNEYFPVYFIGPRPGNRTIYGFDVASEPTRHGALLLACDTGETVASGQIDFVQGETKTAGFLLVLPIYGNGKSAIKGDRSDLPRSGPKAVTDAQRWSLHKSDLSPLDRRENLRGFVLGVFRPDDMLTAALSKLQPEGIDACLYDPTSPADGRPFPFHASRTRKQTWEPNDADDLNDPKRLHYVARLDVSGNPWMVVCLATPDFVAARRTLWPWGVLAAGLALTALLAAYISSSIDRKTFVEQRLVEKRLHAEQLQDKVRRQTADIRRAQEEVIYRLLSASQCRDEETGAHIRRVGLVSKVLARAVGWSIAEVDCIRQAAPMHDVGKIGIPDAILRKPGKLTPEEFEVIKTHASLGAKMLADSNVPMLKMAEQIALGHHERWDGRGYPNGLAGQDIPECARIVAIADVFDALIHARVYKPAMSEEEALTVMRSEAGTQFDQLLLAHFFLHLPEICRIAHEHPDEEPDAAAGVETLPELQPATDGSGA
ncbi:MAG: CHASE domain-containing protein [Pirellulales bacterium]|nr:CHASE domain-containing protein [Pirellulales bacterium]